MELYNSTLSHVSGAARSHSWPTFPVNQPWNTADNTSAVSLPDQLTRLFGDGTESLVFFKVPHEILMSAKLMNYVFENPMPQLICFSI